MLILLLFQSLFSGAVVVAEECGLYLVPSRITGAGRGVVAGLKFVLEEEIETIPTIQVPKRVTQSSQLVHYVFASNDDRYDLVIFGPGSLYNHHANRSVYYSWTDSDVKDPSQLPFAHTTFTYNTFRTSRAVMPGDEMLNFYGDSWFDRFEGASVGTQPLPPSIDVAELALHGHCMSDVFLDVSTEQDAGLGVFADRDFAAGEVVVVSPVLALPRKLVDSSERITLLKNYCMASSESDLGLFPLSYGAVINHNAPELANVEVGWYDWSPAVEALAAKYRREGDPEPDAGHSLRLADKLAMSVLELFDAPFAQLDIAYRATRAIKQGEELFLDYGADWQAAWEQFAWRLDEWFHIVDTCANGDDADDEVCGPREQMPIFRHYMAVPDHLFPSHWKTEK